ncbi:MAG TPA: efflux transporter outer membrane subunit [Lacunisphaera sp.]|nr:efflux transporter outer membrane subunit [Lacunisphaera sp.]
MHAATPNLFRRLVAHLSPLALLLAAGCTVGPDYHAPAAKVATPAFAAVPATDAGGVDPDGAWWRAFADPELGSLVDRALAANPDITIATQRVRAARAGLAFAEGRAYPQVGVGAAKMEYRKAGPLNTLYRGAYPTFQAGFDASWELDLWGGTRRAVEAAGATLQATDEARHGVQVALAAEVARTYVELRAVQRRLALAQTNLALQRRTLALTRERLQAGLASELDASRADGLVANTEAQVPLLADGIDALIHRLGLLLGEEPGALAPELTAVQPIPVAPAGIATGLPAELLRRRPDIRAAERRLAAATARVGATQAQLYPHLGLGGTLGFVSTHSEDLFEYSNRYFSVGPGLHWNLFDAGRTRAQVEVARAQADAAYAEYRKAVLGALADADNSLGALRAERERHAALVTATEAARRSVDTVTELYRQGVADFLGVIDAERSLAAAEDNLAQSDRSVSTDLIAVFKALGGGWSAAPAAHGFTPTT